MFFANGSSSLFFTAVASSKQTATPLDLRATGTREAPKSPKQLSAPTSSGVQSQHFPGGTDMPAVQFPMLVQKAQFRVSQAVHFAQVYARRVEFLHECQRQGVCLDLDSSHRMLRRPALPRACPTNAQSHMEQVQFDVVWTAFGDRLALPNAAHRHASLDAPSLTGTAASPSGHEQSPLIAGNGTVNQRLFDTQRGQDEIQVEVDGANPSANNACRAANKSAFSSNQFCAPVRVHVGLYSPQDVTLGVWLLQVR